EDELFLTTPPSCRISMSLCRSNSSATFKAEVITVRLSRGCRLLARASTVVPEAINMESFGWTSLAAAAPIRIFSADWSFSFSFTGRSVVYGLLTVAPPWVRKSRFLSSRSLRSFRIVTEDTFSSLHRSSTFTYPSFWTLSIINLCRSVILVMLKCTHSGYLVEIRQGIAETRFHNFLLLRILAYGFVLRNP